MADGGTTIESSTQRGSRAQLAAYCVDFHLRLLPPSLLLIAVEEKLAYQMKGLRIPINALVP